MPRIIKDTSFEDYLIKLIMDNYQTRETREGQKWHVSDLMFARYAVLQRLYPVPPDRDAVGFFLTGEAYHEFIQRLLGQKDSEVKGMLGDVVGTADFFDGSTLLEIKTSRKWTVPAEPQSHYIEQAGYYCAIFNQTRARIAVILPTAGRKFDGSTSSTVEIVAWEVSFTEEELNKIKESMQEMSETLETALTSKSLVGLPFCADWKCGSIERDSEKKEYFIKARCPYLRSNQCEGNPTIFSECQRKMDNRRDVPNSTKKGVKNGKGTVAA